MSASTPPEEAPIVTMSRPVKSSSTIANLAQPVYAPAAGGCELPVHTVTEHEPLEAGVIFVVPANRHVNITDSEIDLRTDQHGRPMPSIDLLFSSAADSFGERLIAVILTGTGSDGTEGARLVRKAGGMVIIQDPETAKFGDMPGSLAPNTVDIVAELDRIGLILGELISGAGVSEAAPRDRDEKRALERFLEELRERHGIDFRSYKTPTIMRRLRRRMVITGSGTIEDYARYLDDHPEEYRQLVNTFLIKVTEFFRDPELFEYLREEVVPGLLEESRERGRQLRVWSAGCATGEEAYSPAILISEVLGAGRGQNPSWPARGERDPGRAAGRARAGGGSRRGRALGQRTQDPATRGLSNRQIAASLHISEATVKRHLANLYSKIGVGSRGEATRKALLQGWITARDLTLAETIAPDPEDAQT
jgi:hypothetical protein